MSVGASFMLEIPFVTVPVCVVAGSLVASIFFLITRVMVACEEKLKYALQDHVKAQTKIEKMQEALDSSKQALSTVRSELATSVQNLGKAREELAQKSHPQTERRSADVHDISTRIAETTG
jgi:F0F1-type ATP synthase membrane subunit b/b'